MDLNLIIDKYLNRETIFIDEISCNSKNYLRQELKKYTDNGIFVRHYNGVNYKRYKTILGNEGSVSIDKYFEIKGEEYKCKLKDFVNKTKVNFEYVKKYISSYSPIVYKNIYEGGLMKELL